ncbi:AI-2E family transporter [Roseateles sp. SL47]|uniref:AI-2E family transporter n=1 Tax=Roseateles sp. SL47 TaxID=2995138 RepID=UPI00226DB5A9|nr:AI-2E family transporter [Roseateles sp. SL47]WAC75393.1 AI-2E family transporter [Roseateles sp. SL47]
MHAPSTANAPTPLAVKLLVGLGVLAVLYLGREVLEPITLAAMLSFLMAPVVRKLRSLGLNQTTAAIGTLTLAGLVVAGIAMVLLMQLGALSRELPAYEENVRAKVTRLRMMTLDQLQQAQGRAGRMIGDLAVPGDTSPRAIDDDPTAPTARTTDGKAENSAMLVRQFLSAVWGPVGVVGIVVLVLIFALLEQDALRDRLIRLVGGHDVRTATAAFNDAGQRLSRYFVSQFLVNVGVGLVIGVLLFVTGVPHATIWAVLAGLLRFIPYVGFPAAAVCAGVMSAAMAPGWDLMVSTLLIFLAVEVVVAHVIEPQLYGHATGLSPFSVVVSAIFWSALWGPVGLLLSTPLTLCLVVAGRHVPALAFLDVLLGDAPALDLSQRFYQRSLSGDSVEILADARTYLKRRTLARYCDRVVVPAVDLARRDMEQNLITPDQLRAAQEVMLEVFAALTHTPLPRRRKSGVLDGADLGLRMRQERLHREGRWQGSIDVPAGSVMLCVSMGDPGAHLMAEILVRVLRDSGFDARHIIAEELTGPPDDAKLEAIGTVFVVGAAVEEQDLAEVRLLNDFLVELPSATVVMMMLAGQVTRDPIANDRTHHTAYSFEEVLALMPKT